jgi:hypothetical protein
MGLWLDLASHFYKLTSGIYSFDNSGQRMPTPMWASNHTNVARTNAIIKTIAGMFKDNPTNVPIIAPLNEFGVLTMY